MGIILSEKTVLVMPSARTSHKYPDQFSSPFCILLLLFFFLQHCFLKHLEILIFFSIYTLKYVLLRSIKSIEYIPLG